GSCMGVLHNRKLERKCFGVSEKVLGRKNWNNDRREMSATGEQDQYDYRLKPTQPASACSRAGSTQSRLDHHRAGSQQHGIDWRKVVILSVQKKERRVTDQITPSEYAIRL